MPELTRLAPGSHPGALWVTPIYRELGYREALPEVWVRARALQGLRRAALAAAHRGHGLLVWDGWRSLELQRVLYDDFRARLRESSGMAGAELDALVAKFVTDPDRASAPPGHSTGGVVDITLCDLESGAPLDLGGEFDELTDRTLPDYYDAEQDAESVRYARLRTELAEAMRAGEFVRLETEWWHFEYGTAYWSDVTGHPAIFGRTDGPDG